MARLDSEDTMKYRFAALQNYLTLNRAKRCLVASSPPSRVFQHMVSCLRANGRNESRVAFFLEIAGGFVGAVFGAVGADLDFVH